MSDENKKNEQNIPPEVMDKLPPEIKAQLGVENQEKTTIFAPGTDTKDLSDSLARLREGFEKIGLTLIGRMGEFTTTLERVSMAVSRIDTIETAASEVSYLMKKIEKKLDDFNVSVSKISKNYEDLTYTISEIRNDINSLKSGVPMQQISPQPQIPETPSEPVSTRVTFEPVSTPDKSDIQIPDIEGGPLIKENITNIDIPEIEGEAIVPGDSTDKEPPEIETTATPEGEEIFQVGISTPDGEMATSPAILLQMTFESLSEQIQVGVPYFKIADILDSTRSTLQKSVGWNPLIYTIGKEARNIRRKEGNMDQETANYLVSKLEEWKTKLIEK